MALTRNTRLTPAQAPVTTTTRGERQLMLMRTPLANLQGAPAIRAPAVDGDYAPGPTAGDQCARSPASADMVTER
jgi:hypothetical protein